MDIFITCLQNIKDFLISNYTWLIPLILGGIIIPFTIYFLQKRDINKNLKNKIKNRFEHGSHQFNSYDSSTQNIEITNNVITEDLIEKVVGPVSENVIKALNSKIDDEFKKDQIIREREKKIEELEETIKDLKRTSKSDKDKFMESLVTLKDKKIVEDSWIAITRKERLDKELGYYFCGVIDFILLDFNKSLECFKKALELSPNNIVYKSEIAKIYIILNKYDKALNHFLDIKNFYDKRKERDSIGYGLLLNDLGGAYLGNGDIDKAIELYHIALDILNRNPKENIVNIGITNNNIGNVYFIQKNYSKAFEFYNIALDIYKKYLGEENRYFAGTLANIGIAHDLNGDDLKALECHKKALSIELNIYGENHPDVANTLNNIGVTYKKLGKFDRSVESHEKAIEIRKKILGEDSIQVASSLFNLATTRGAQKDYDKALDNYINVYHIYEKENRENEKEYAITGMHIGGILCDLDRRSEAIPFLEKSENMLSKNPESNRGELEMVRKVLNNARKLTMFKNRDLVGLKKIVVENIKSGNPDIFDWFNYGNICSREGNEKEAINAFLKVIELDKNDKRAWFNLGNSYWNRGLFQDAENAYKESLKIDPNNFFALLNLGNVLESQGKHKEAKEIEKIRNMVAETHKPE
jgi:tetratricopeptide (TPR) repeat protein